MPNRKNDRGAMTPSVGALSGSSNKAPPTNSASTTILRITMPARQARARPPRPGDGTVTQRREERRGFSVGDHLEQEHRQQRGRQQQPGIEIGTDLGIVERDRDGKAALRQQPRANPGVRSAGRGD